MVIIKIAMPRNMNIPTIMALLLSFDFMVIYKIVIIKISYPLIITFKNFIKTSFCKKFTIKQHSNSIAGGFSTGKIMCNNNRSSMKFFLHQVNKVVYFNTG